MLHVDEADLLNGTPVLDIKPYIPMADAFPDARAGWVEAQAHDLWSVSAGARFAEQNAWIAERSPFDLFSFAHVQLSHGPFDDTRRRLLVNRDSSTGMLAYRTFRIFFSFDSAVRTIQLDRVESGYTLSELENPDDRYGDKQLHRDFVALWQ